MQMKKLFVAIRDPALGQIVGRKLQSDAISGQHADAIAAEFSSQMGQDVLLLVELHTEQTTGKFLYNRSGDFNAIFCSSSLRANYISRSQMIIPFSRRRLASPQTLPQPRRIVGNNGVAACRNQTVPIRRPHAPRTCSELPGETPAERSQRRLLWLRR